MSMLHSSLLADTVRLDMNDRLLMLNSAADPFVPEAARRLSTGELILAEDNIASLQTALSAFEREHVKTQFRVRHVSFHEYTLNEAPANIDVAVMNMVFQPGNTWIIYGLQVAAYALKPGGCL